MSRDPWPDRFLMFLLMVSAAAMVAFTVAMVVWIWKMVLG